MSNLLISSYLIGLREGLEATLVVTILVAFLVKSGRKGRLPLVWAGVGSAVALSVLLGVLLTYVSDSLLSFKQRELFEAITSTVAVAFVTWMIFWMRRAARHIKKDLTDALEKAINLGPIAVVTMAFLAVAREGIETSVLFFANVQGATTSSSGLIGIVGGLLTSVVLGFFMYLGAVRINLTKFFRWTGVLLVLVAAGILKYGVHDFQEAGVLPGLHNTLFDISSVLPPSSWYAELLRGMLNITPNPTVLESLAWVLYAVPVLILFLLPTRKPKAVRPEVTKSEIAEPETAKPELATAEVATTEAASV